MSCLFYLCHNTQHHLSCHSYLEFVTLMDVLVQNHIHNYFTNYATPHIFLIIGTYCVVQIYHVIISLSFLQRRFYINTGLEVWSRCKLRCVFEVKGFIKYPVQLLLLFPFKFITNFAGCEIFIRG